MGTPITVILHKDKVTKNAIRFSSDRVGDDPHTKSVYILKNEVEQLGNPEQVKITIEAA